jgi:hypothetical protein
MQNHKFTNLSFIDEFINSNLFQFKQFIENTKQAENIKKFIELLEQSYSTIACWPDKFFYGCGTAIGLISSFACGLSTGGAIFVLLVGCSLPLGLVTPLSLLFFLAGARANFQLFSQHIPHFFQDIYKNRVTAFTVKEGEPLQLSARKKFLLLPAGFFSLSVGIASAAITYLEGTKMIALICPMLASTCPHLAAVLLTILASALLICLTIVMFRTFIRVLHSQFSWGAIKQDIKEKWQSLNCTEGLGYVFKVLLMFAAFFGLVYLDFTGTSTLADLLGWVAAYAITLAAIIGDLPFTLIAAVDFCNSLLTKNGPNPGLTKDIKYYLGKILEFSALIINALGNAALVWTGSPISILGSVAAFLNSYFANRTQNQGDESQLTQTRVNGAVISPPLFLGAASNNSSGFFQPSLSNDEERPNTSISLICC